MNDNVTEVEKTNTGLTDPVEKHYLRLLPLDKEKIDIFLVFNREYPLVAKWLDLFFSAAGWETDIHADFLQTELFRHFYFESKNIQKTQGEHRFAFGFPLVLEKNEPYIPKPEPDTGLSAAGIDDRPATPEPSDSHLTLENKWGRTAPAARSLTKTFTVYASDEPLAVKDKNNPFKEVNSDSVNLVPGADSAGLITAPLFIWYLHTKPHPTRKDSWIIGREEGRAVVPNDYLIRFYQAKYGVNLKNRLYRFALQKSFTRDGLEALCREVGGQMGYVGGLIHSGLRECPSLVVLRGLKTSGDISWSGALGLFPHQQAQSVTLPSLAGTPAESATGPDDFLSALSGQVKSVEPGHEFSLLPEDVYQKAAFRTSLRNKLSLIEGGHGTGKTHTAVNLILNALSNGQKTVAVASDLATLIQIQNALAGFGLGNLSVLLKDLLSDQALIRDALRNEAGAKKISFQEDAFKITLKQGRRLLVKSDARHRALNEGIFGGEPFSEIVGRYLQSRELGGKEILSAYLSAKDYEFSKEEFAGLREATLQSKKLFQKVNTLKHTLGVLHPDIFLRHSRTEGKRFAEEQTAFFLAKFRTLQRRYVEVADVYAQKLLSYYERHHAGLSDQLNNLKDDFSDFSFQYGADFERNDFIKTGSLTVASVFSRRSKQALQAKSDALGGYAELQKLYNERKHFTHAFLPTAERKDFKKIRLNLQTFELALDAWRKKTPSLMQEEMGRLNGKTSVFFDPDSGEDVKDLETDTDSLDRELNESGLYETGVRHKTLTLLKRQLFVEDLIEQLEDTRNQIRDFDDYYDWRRYWLQLTPGGQKLIQGLIKVKPENWTAAFESWYFYNMLLKYYQSDSAHSDELLLQMNDIEDNLRKSMPEQIAGLWSARKVAAIQHIKREDPAVYKSLHGQAKLKQDESFYLKDLLRDHLAHFTETYPVLLATPQAYSQIFENNPNVAGLTIFENGVPADLPTLRLAAETSGRIVVMDENDGTDPDPATFAGMVKQAGAPSSWLNFLHGVVSDTARRINEAVFYPGLQKPFMSEAAVGQSVQIVHAGGKWNATSQTNEAEIKAVVKTLEEIDATPFNTYPRIGVVCMNKTQRNALSAALLHIVQKTVFGWEKIAHLQRNGLSVFSIEEIGGLEFDILIVSGAYDQIGDFPADKKSLRGALNSFIKKLIWINSIPIERLAEAQKEPEQEARCLLASLLLLSGRLSEDRPDAAQSILAELEQRYKTVVETKPSVFAGQIRSALARWISPAQVREHFLIGGYVFPLVVVDKGGKNPVAIRTDGRFQAVPYFNPDWDRKTLAELARLQIPVVSIWSYNWWKSPQQEAENLAYALMTLHDKAAAPIHIPE